jgi:hypothetical protein
MDVRAYVTSTRFTVVVAAIAIAIPTAWGVYEFTDNYALAFLAMFTLGVSVPQAYSRSWPTEYDHLEGVAWTIAACAVALAILLVAAVAVGVFFGDLGTAIGAYLVAQISISAITHAIENRSEEASDAAGNPDVDDTGRVDGADAPGDDA